MDSSDISTFMVMMQEMTDRLVSSMDQLNSTKNMNSTLTDIKSALINIQKQNDKAYNFESNPNNNQNFSAAADRIVEAINNGQTSRPGGESELSKEAPEKSVLEEYAKEAKERKAHTAAVTRQVNDALTSVKRSMTSISKQIGSGSVNLPIVSGIVKSLTGPTDMYRKMVAAGQDFGGSLEHMRSVASQSGLTMDQFTKSMVQGSQGVRLLGPETFAGLTRSVKDSISTFGDLGMTGDQLNDAMNEYIDGMKRSGRLHELNGSNFRQSFDAMALSAAQLAHTLGISQDEAMKKLNEAKANPDVQVLEQRMNATQRGNFEYLHAFTSKLPQTMQTIIHSAQWSANTGSGPNQETMEMIQRLPNGQEVYNRLVQLTKLQQDAGSAAERTRYQNQMNDVLKSIARPGNTATSILNGVYAQYGNQGARAAEQLESDAISYNSEEVNRNAGTVPKNVEELAGTTPLTRALTGVNDASEQMVRDMEEVKTAMINNNAQFLAASTDSYNKFVVTTGDTLKEFGDKTAGMLGNFSSGLPTQMASWFGDHPFLFGGAMVGASLAGGALKTAVTKRVGRYIANRTFKSSATKEAEEAGEHIASRGIGSTIKGASKYGLRAIPIVGSMISAGMSGVEWYHNRQDLARQLASNKISRDEYNRRLAKNNWTSVGGFLGGIGAGTAISLTGAGVIGSGAASIAGTAGGELLAESLYDKWHPRESKKADNSTNPSNSTTNPKPPSNSVINGTNAQGANNQDNQTTPEIKSYTLEDVVESLNKGFTFSQGQMDVLIKTIVDVDRSIKNSGGVVQP